MRKKWYALLAGAAAIGSLILGCGGNAPDQLEKAAQTDDVIVMRLAHINAETDPKQKEAEKFARLVAEKTNGKVRVEVYGAGVLGDVREIIEGLQLGTNEIVIEGYGTIASYTKTSLLDLVPFMYRDYEHFSKVWNGDLGREILQKSGDEAGMQLFGPSYRGVRVVTSTKRFSTLEELRGLKIRVPGDDMSLKTWQSLGAAPTPMAMNEVLTGIQQGTVDAQENPPILSYNFGLADVCKYLIRTNHRWSADVFMMNKAYFDRLPPDVRQAILEAGAEAARYASQTILESEGECFEQWKAAGAEIVDPDISALKAACGGLVAKDFPELSEYVRKIQEVQ